jgi:hypothetical protein
MADSVPAREPPWFGELRRSRQKIDRILYVLNGRKSTVIRFCETLSAILLHFYSLRRASIACIPTFKYVTWLSVRRVTDQATWRPEPSGIELGPEKSRAEIAAFKYRAFLSYSHRDTKWVRWLHNALEGYRVEKDLVGRTTPFGPVPKTLRPIFRDRDDFSAGHSLTEQTLAALEASQFMIVLCSPNAAGSPYVNEEIRHFKALGRPDRVIAVIVDGEPGDEQLECFPPAMRFRLGADAELTGEREEPIAADARPQGDGKQLTLSKVVAGLLGIGLDEVVRRAERGRKRRRRFLIGAAVAVAMLIAGAAAGWWGALSVVSRLDSAETLNDAYLAADFCDSGNEFAVAHNVEETRRITHAMKCVMTLGGVLDGLPQDIHVPTRILGTLGTNLAILRRCKSEGKLTSDQLDMLMNAETLSARWNPDENADLNLRHQ